MTPDQLEREMFFAIHEFGPTDNGNTGNKEFDKELHRAAKAAADLCRQKMREVVLKAFDESRLTENGTNKYFYTAEEWLRENNLLNDNEIKISG